MTSIINIQLNLDISEKSQKMEHCEPDVMAPALVLDLPRVALYLMTATQWVRDLTLMTDELTLQGFVCVIMSGLFVNIRRVKHEIQWGQKKICQHLRVFHSTRWVCQHSAAESWVTLSINSTEFCQNVLEQHNETPTCSHILSLSGLKWYLNAWNVKM